MQNNRADIFCRLSTIHERERQKNRPRNGNIDRNRPNRLSAMSPKMSLNLQLFEPKIDCIGGRAIHYR